MRRAVDEDGKVQEVETPASVEIKRSQKGDVYWTTKSYAMFAPVAALESVATDTILQAVYQKGTTSEEIEARLKNLKTMVDGFLVDYLKFQEEVADRLEAEMEAEAEEETETK